MGDLNNLNVEDPGTGSGAAESQPGASNQTPPSIDGIVEQLLPLLSTKLQSQIEELTKPYLGQLEGLKKVQGNLDRSQNEFKERLAELNKLTKAGMSQDEAIEHLDKQKAESERWENLQRELSDLRSLITGTGNRQQQNTVADVFSKFGLDLKHPSVATELLKQYKNSDEMEVAALRLFHKLQTTPNPNDAQAPALQGGDDGQKTKKDISTVNDSSQLYALAEQELYK